MKCTGISVSNGSSRYEPTLFEFVGSQQARSLLGELLIALVQETVWSGAYMVSASFGDGKPHLGIGHETFLPDRPLIISDETGTDWTVRRVEDAVRAHLWELHKESVDRIAKLQQDANAISEAAFRIVIDNAREAVVTAFPEARGATYIPCQAARHDLYAFAQNGIENVYSNPVYVVRVVGDEIVDGIARIESTVLEWYRMKEEERLECFWAELAWTFAVLSFLPTDEPRRRGHVFSTKVHSKILQNLHAADPYHVDKAVFPAHKRLDIVVEFGTNNLPKKAYTTPQETVGLVDRHMTP